MGLAGSECVRAKIKLEDFYVHVRLDAGISSIIREHASRFPLEIIPFRSGKQRDIYNLLWLFIRLSNFDSKFVSFFLLTNLVINLIVNFRDDLRLLNRIDIQVVSIHLGFVDVAIRRFGK